MNRSLLLAAAVVAMLCASPASHSAEAPGTALVGTGRFTFHSDPWLNLHHFLYQWARAEEGLGDGRTAVAVPERDELRQLDMNSRARWRASVNFYRENVAGLDHFDSDMLRQKAGLLGLSGDTGETPPAHISGIDAALVNAMPLYLAQWWPSHQEANLDWATRVSALLARHEGDFVDLAARVYGTGWPMERIRIDLSAYANFRAGYTANGHTVMYTTDPGNQGRYGFEMLLHEVQHTRAVRGVARDELRERFAAAGRNVPANLWHAMIFVTAGAFAEFTASKDGVTHEAYWRREGFAEIDNWGRAIAASEAHWLPVIVGDIERDDAFTRLVNAYRNN